MYGVPVGNDVTRFVVKYANAQRWKQSEAVSISQAASLFQQVSTLPFLPRQPFVNESHLQDLPPACPQPGSTSTSEDCLYMTIYVPNSVGAGRDAPTLFWFVHRPVVFYHTRSVFLPLRIPGGSFLVGSASDPSINGAKLAAATQSIVTVVQHRLGGVGAHLSLSLSPCLLMCSSVSWLPTERPTWPSTTLSML
jgi:carboxylesterase type B